MRRMPWPGVSRDRSLSLARSDTYHRVFGRSRSSRRGARSRWRAGEWFGVRHDRLEAQTCCKAADRLVGDAELDAAHPVLCVAMSPRLGVRTGRFVILSPQDANPTLVRATLTCTGCRPGSPARAWSTRISARRCPRDSRRLRRESPVAILLRAVSPSAETFPRGRVSAALTRPTVPCDASAKLQRKTPRASRPAPSITAVASLTSRRGSAER